ncbi:MAG: hypothetical protein C5B51_28150 [Terriglobia bacterium]|nr:MAG: hypothetical protein C5B51_28150 [Terriglobia bacterium]
MEQQSGRQRWLTVTQLMEVVPLKKSRVYYLTHTRQIPFVRLGKTLLFDYDVIIKWVEAHGEPIGISSQAR